MTVIIHSLDFKPGALWKKQTSDLVGFEKYRQEMPKDVYGRLRAKVIALSLITLGGYYIYLKCTKEGKDLLCNLKEKSIIHYIPNSSEKSESQKTAAKTDSKAKGIQPAGKSREVKTCQATFNKTKVVVTRADITKEPVDAIVNAANSVMLGGGGVDGAIHRAAGPKLLEECKKVEPDETGNRCGLGKAVITGAGNLPAKHVIHTVGPRDSTPERAKYLRDAHFNSLSVAADHNLKTVTFPAISIGSFNYPLDEAAPLAIRAVREFAEQNDQIKEVRFAILIPDADKDSKAKLLEDTIFQAYGKALEAESSKPFEEKKSSFNVDYQKIFNDAVAKAGISGGSARYLEDLFQFKLKEGVFQGEALQNKNKKLKFKEEFLNEIQEDLDGFSTDPDWLVFLENFKNIGFESLNEILTKALGIIPKKVGFKDSLTVHVREENSLYDQWVKEATDAFEKKLTEFKMPEEVTKELSIDFNSSLADSIAQVDDGEKDRLIDRVIKMLSYQVQGIIFEDEEEELSLEEKDRIAEIKFAFENYDEEIKEFIKDAIISTRPNTWGA